jgi:phosphohistidine phosphatase SixA
MRLILVRHGAREHREEYDRFDPLTAEGRLQIAAVRAALDADGLAATRCYSSEHVHAKQTAEILAARDGAPSIDIIAVPSLTPHGGKATLEEFLELAGASGFGPNEVVLVVAHRPRVDNYLTQMTDTKSADLEYGETVCVAADTVEDLMAGRGLLEWRR